MRFTDGFRLAELAAGDESRRARDAIDVGMRDAIEADEPSDRESKTRWLKQVTAELRRTPTTTDARAAAILGARSTFEPRRRFRPPSGLKQHLVRWLRSEPSSVRAAREIAELEGRWDE